jgi:hypothetical protein
MKFLKIKSIDKETEYYKIKKIKGVEYGEFEHFLCQKIHFDNDTHLFCRYISILPMLMRKVIDKGREMSENGWTTVIIIYSPNENKKTYKEPKMTWYYERRNEI